MQSILIVSHERSLNKTKAIVQSLYKDFELTLVVDQEITRFQNYSTRVKIIVSSNFDKNEIGSSLKSEYDYFFCMSENLYPLCYEIDRDFLKGDKFDKKSSAIVANKLKFNQHCRSIGLEKFMPLTMIPISAADLVEFGDKPVIVKPDNGTGCFPSLSVYDPEIPQIEYTYFPSSTVFVEQLKKSGFDQDFFWLNKEGLRLKRYNREPTRFLVQEVCNSDGVAVSPCGVIEDGHPQIWFYLKCKKVPFKGELASDSSTDLLHDLAVWSVDKDDLPQEVISKIDEFLLKMCGSLEIRNMFFSGPDFYFGGRHPKAIDFNPRLGFFYNMLESHSANNLTKSYFAGEYVGVNKHMIWSASSLKPGEYLSISELENLESELTDEIFLREDHKLIPEVQTLQNRDFNLSYKIFGENEKELMDKVHEFNERVQSLVRYKK